MKIEVAVSFVFFFNNLNFKMSSNGYNIIILEILKIRIQFCFFLTVSFVG